MNCEQNEFLFLRKKKSPFWQVDDPGSSNRTPRKAGGWLYLARCRVTSVGAASGDGRGTPFYGVNVWIWAPSDVGLLVSKHVASSQSLFPKTLNQKANRN